MVRQSSSLLRLTAGLALLAMLAPSTRAGEYYAESGSIDLGNYYLSVFVANPNSGNGWVSNYWSGDVSWWTVQWSCTNSEVEIKPDVGKGTIAKSKGYPKRIDSTASTLWTRANWTWKDWGTNGKAGVCCTIWTDDTNPTNWVFTNEVMIFERYNNRMDPWNWATWVGSFNHEGSQYDTWAWANAAGNRSYIMLRKSQRDGGWIDAKAILNWLRNPSRGTHQIQNHYIDQIVWGPDVFPNTSGEYAFNSIYVPDL